MYPYFHSNAWRSIIDLCVHTSLSQLVHSVTTISSRTCTKRPQMMPNHRPCSPSNAMHDVSQELPRTTHTETLSDCFWGYERKEMAAHHPANAQDESYEVGARNAGDVVGTKVNASTNLLPSTASRHTCNHIRSDRSRSRRTMTE